jgi:hypothetical protein
MGGTSEKLGAKVVGLVNGQRKVNCLMTFLPQWEEQRRTVDFSGRLRQENPTERYTLIQRASTAGSSRGIVRR